MDQLRDQLKSLLQNLDAEMRQKWNRSLSWDELINDRWARAKALGFGEGASLYGSSLVFGEVQVGKKVWIGPFTLLDGSGAPLSIGDFCHLSAHVSIYTHDTVQNALSAGEVPRETAAVSVGACTYIGPQTVIQRGVSIGDHCVIGANSFVNRSIPAFSFACGNPCRVQGKVVKDPGHPGRFVIQTKKEKQKP